MGVAALVWNLGDVYDTEGATQRAYVAWIFVDVYIYIYIYIYIYKYIYQQKV